MNDVTSLLQLDGLCKSFGERRAVDGVSFRVAQGQTLGLLGPNGAGKSTTVSLICGLLRADSGQLKLNGKPVAFGDESLKRMLGLVPQELALYDDLSALENLKLFGALYDLRGAALQARCTEVLQLVNLEERAHDKPRSFSGGMKRRLNIAAALLHDPQLLILDEPTVGIDPQSRNAIFDSLETLKAQGRSLIYTSHYMEEVERLADHIVIIDHGKVIADESPADLYRRLPAKTALIVDLLEAPDSALQQQLTALPGVVDISLSGQQLHIGLQETAQGIAVLNWLVQQGLHPQHYSTAKNSLEAVFLSLTGRNLRD